MTEQELDFKMEDETSVSGHPWMSLRQQKTGIILFRLRLPGHFNLVERLYKPDYKGSDFLEGRIDTQCHLDWDEDVDIRKIKSLETKKLKVIKNE